MAVEALLFPLDCMKTRAQSWGSAALPANALLARGLYRGLSTAVASSAPASAAFFSVYELVKHALEAQLAPNGGALSRTGHCGVAVLASVTAELVACGVRCPADLVKQRLQVGRADSVAEACRGLRGASGASALLAASFRASAARDILHSGLQFPLYEGCKLALAERTRCSGGADGLPAWQAALCGSVAGAVAAALTNPLDLLRTRVNLAPAAADGCAAAGHRGLAEAADARAEWTSSKTQAELLRLYRVGGVPGLFVGARLRAAWMGLGGFVFLGAFELAKDRLGGRGVA